MIKKSALVCVLLAILLLISCGDGLHGTYSLEEYDELGTTYITEYTLNEDGTFIIACGKSEGEKETAFNGTYEISENSITFYLTAANIPQTYSFEQKSSSIVIDGKEYTRK